MKHFVFLIHNVLITEVEPKGLMVSDDGPTNNVSHRKSFAVYTFWIQNSKFALTCWLKKLKNNSDSIYRSQVQYQFYNGVYVNKNEVCLVERQYDGVSVPCNRREYWECRSPPRPTRPGSRPPGYTYTHISYVNVQLILTHPVSGVSELTKARHKKLCI